MKLSIVLELVAGLLLAAEFVLPSSVHTKLEGWFFQRLKQSSEEGPLLSRGVMVSSLALTVSTLIIVFLGTWAQDVTSFPMANVVSQDILVIVGSILGLVLLAVVSRLAILLLRWIGAAQVLLRYLTLFFVFMVVLAGALLVIRVSPSFLIPLDVGFAYGAAILASVTFLTSPVGQFLASDRYHVLIRIGVGVFVVSKVMQFLLPI